MFLFNVRVYGLLINEQNQILISDEEHQTVRFSKFPGGGLEYGEGLTDALKREFMEECETEIDVLDHVYTTDFFEKSSFNESQIISIYYLVKPVQPLNCLISTSAFDFSRQALIKQSFRWIPIENLSEDDVTFLTDKIAIQKLQAAWKKKEV
ncbi:NUDIX domain-containing protein [Arcticibacter eurypsychrophilus]|uniref:NUDIX domain-containing protein n=1 Tax=Arcticibacter eurypsychrophilus TaxID=1434752 RepID=UPI00084D463A|nr:NUDIX domain-containing protein [Arcticibacter eurypsychrophilus]